MLGILAALASQWSAASPPPFEPTTTFYKSDACAGGMTGDSVEEIGREHSARTFQISPVACSGQCTNQAIFVGVVSANSYRTQSLCTGSRFIHVVEEIVNQKDNGPPCHPDKPCTGSNPINPATGNKYQHERDFQGAGPMPLTFERHYNSHAADAFAIVDSGRPGRPAIGLKWRTTYDRSISHVADLTPPLAKVARPNARVFRFQLENGTWVGEADVRGALVQLADGWEFTDRHNVVERYDADGKLLTISRTQGNFLTQTLAYDTWNRLATVTGPFGRTLSFTYDGKGRIDTMTDPAGNEYRYTYADDNLVAVVYPDDTPANSSDNPTRSYHYEDAQFPNALTGITDERGIRFATYAYDAEGRAISSEHANGANLYAFAYNVDGTTTITDPLGQDRVYSFENIHGAAKNSGISGGPCATCGSQPNAITYDANGYPSSTTDFNSNITNLTLDARGLETSRTEAVGTPEERTISTEWHTDFRLPTRVAEPGKTTAFTYDGEGRLLSRTETDTVTNRSRTVTNTYTPEGLLATIDGARTDVADVTTLAYDAEGNLTQLTNALGHQHAVTGYDANGRPLVLEDPNGLVTMLTYDARGRLISRDVGGRMTTFDNDAVGNITRTTLPDGSFVIFAYDGAQRLAAMEDAFGNRTEYTLDAVGNRVGEAVRDPGSTITRSRSRVFNSFNRLVREIGGAGQQTEFEYDPEGNQTAVVDGNHARTTSSYDALNRLANVTDPELGETDLAYDGRNNLVSVTDAEGLSTTYTYDGLENLVVQSSPDTGMTLFTYDDAGNRITRTDARGVLADFHYDPLDRLVAVEYPDATKDVDLEYDTGPNGIGRLSRVTDASGSTEFAYDARGNRLSETRTIDGIAYVTAYGYDEADRVQSITYPSGTVVAYTRDAAGRINRVTATTEGVTQTLAASIAYLPFGPIESFDYGNGIPLNRVFDQDYRLVEQTAGNAQDLTLGYDPANNITSLIDGLDSARDQSLTYDGLNRLIHAQGVYGTRAYSYDRIGNRLSLSSSAGLDTYDYATDSHRLESIAGANGTSFQYDANGNTIAKGPLAFTYDDTNRMTEALVSGVGVAAYTYNAMGERVMKTGQGSGTPMETILFSDAFSAPDGTVIDDQPGGVWRGKRPKSNTSATVDDGTARVAPGEAIRTKELFTDTGDTTLMVRARLAQGVLVLKHPDGPQGVRVRFNGNRRVVVTSGVLDDDTQRTKVIFRLPAPSATIDIELRIRAGSTRVVVADDQGGLHDTGDIGNAALNSDDVYRLKLRAVKVAGVPVPGIFDEIRVSRSADTGTPVTTHFVYESNGKLIGEYNATGSRIAEYIYLNSQPLAMLRNQTTYLYHADHLGTPKALTDSGQKLVWRARYTPFGDTIISVNVIESPLRFPGQYFDAETGLHYNYSRDYDPSTGRYVQSDPIGLRGGINTYAYVGGNPIRFDDRFGLESFDGGDLGALVPTGPTYFFGSVNVLQSAFEGRISAEDFGMSAGRSDLRFLEAAIVGGVCEKPCSSPSSSSVKLPRDFVTLSIQVPGTRFGFEFRPDGTQCFTIGFGLSPFANESQPHLPRPPLADPFITGS